MIAVLPMYDRPEIRGQTDALWQILRDRLHCHGIEAPDALSRDLKPMHAWLAPNLVLGQTCGLPYRKHLAARVQMVGTPDYGLDDCPKGYYRSAWIARADDARQSPRDFSNGTFAYNDRGSQSGFAVAKGLRFRRTLETGAHAQSITSVAKGHADIAAIDAVTWRFAKRFDAAAEGLKVVEWSPPTPGLPLICAGNQPIDRIREAVAQTLETLPLPIATALGIEGLVSVLSYDDQAFPSAYS